MTPIAKALDYDDRQAVAAYYAGLAAPLWIAPSRPDTAAAELYHGGDPSRALPACAGCHGAAGEGLGAANPPLAGQPAAYLAEQLRLWRDSRRRNDPLGVMLAISRSLTPAEIAAISRYAAAPSRLPAPAPGRPAASP
jgi:cytochrome c553